MNYRKSHAIAIALIATAALLNQARADQVNVGASDGPRIKITGTTVGLINGVGGDFANSTLNGNTLPWVYCVDVIHTVNPNNPPIWNNAAVTNNGVVNGAAVHNADEIAYVLLNHGGDLANHGAVQAAIWFLEYGRNGTHIHSIDDGNGHNSTSLITTAYAYVAAAQAANTTNLASQLAWLTLNPNPNHYAQGLVTIITPEPSSFAIAALAGLGMLAYARRRRSR